MDKAKVEDLMIPANDLVAIKVDDSFAAAVEGLAEALDDFKAGKRALRALIVLDEKGQMVGKISPVDVLRSMEPGYDKLLNMDSSVHVSKFGYLIQSLREEIQHAALPWDRLCQTAKTHTVQDIMRKPAHSQIIQMGESLNEAIHRFVLGKHRTLFVTDGNKLVGLLDLSLIYLAIVDKLKTECTLS